MPAVPFPVLALGAIAAFILQYAISRYRFNKKYKFPNVVPGLPILGNSLQVPFPAAGMWGVETARKYGEMYTCFLGGTTLVFLNSARVVNDLMEKRASIYSSRPYRPLCQDIMSGGVRMLLMPYSDKWRNQRKIMHSILNGQQAETKFVPYQELEAKQLVYDYLREPEKFNVANQAFANSVIMSVVFGRRASIDDPELKAILKAVADLGEYLFNPMKNLVDAFPWLAKLPKPLQWWRPAGEAYFKNAISIYQHELDKLLVKMDNGTARPCFAVDVIQAAEKKEFQIGEHEKLFVFSTLLEAGSDTSRNAITQMVAAAAVYPEWVQKARLALDKVCGANAERLPSLSDRDAVPYMTAVVKETLRWRPFIQTGVPHMLTQDDEYEGYKFPAGTMFTWNAYALALNENDYEDPERFMPERFMNKDLKNPLKGHWSFGTGRRVCVGYNVAQNNMWLAMACLIYCFDFAEDPEHPIDTFNTNWEEWARPPFKVKIKPRSGAHVELINRVSVEALNAHY
ncbi:related to cytochrome P450 [Phialocephala subalpina]|uniref:Related to cytochrome P450 n=1 Tax=Phialocephala subalpina TaxID=576137 RepID=A0A1L7XUS2_9HELO|nr:related to cytochrome P450 [Phialocephala subalpina]